MAFRIPQNSLFATLLRSPWWYSALVGLFIIAISFVIAGGQYVIIGIFTSLPFFAIAGAAGRRQLKQPSRQQILQAAEQAQSMSPAQIAERIASPYVEERFDAEPFAGADADLLLTRGNRIILVCTKRFKASNTGIGPLKRLVAAGESVEASAFMYVSLGDVSDAAATYARDNDIELIQAKRLAAFLDGSAKID